MKFIFRLNKYNQNFVHFQKESKCFCCSFLYLYFFLRQTQFSVFFVYKITNEILNYKIIIYQINVNSISVTHFFPITNLLLTCFIFKKIFKQINTNIKIVFFEKTRKETNSYLGQKPNSIIFYKAIPFELFVRRYDLSVRLKLKSSPNSIRRLVKNSQLLPMRQLGRQKKAVKERRNLFSRQSFRS